MLQAVLNIDDHCISPVCFQGRARYLAIYSKDKLLEAIRTHSGIGDLEVVDTLTAVWRDLVVEIGGYAIACLPASSRERSVGAGGIGNTSAGSLSGLDRVRIWCSGDKTAERKDESTAKSAGR